MKKRISPFLATAAAAVLLTSCGSSGTYGKYVTLGEYKGLSVNMIRSEVSDDTLQDEIDSVIQEHAQYDPITDRACENGDVVNIDFTGTIDGAEFDGGSATDYDLELGEGYFIDELEEGIAGMKTGETKEIPVTFPEDYNEDLAGKEAVFSVTLNSISQEILPEYNDEFVASISDFTTTADYEADLKATLLSQAEENNRYLAGSDALTAAVANATFKGYPQELYDACKQEYDDMNAMYAEIFGMDPEDLALDDDETKETVEQMVYEQMVVTAIAEKEKLKVTDDEYSDYVNSIYEDYGYESVEDFESDYSKDSTMEELLQSKVQDFLLDNASITEISEDDYYAQLNGSDEDYEDFSEEDTEDELILDLETADTEVLSDVELPLDSESETETEAASETESVSESST